MHIVLINQFYPPASAPTGLLLRDLARVLSRRGHGVTIIASSGFYKRMHGGTEVSVPEGIDVIRAGPSRRHRMDLLNKFIDYVRFYPAAYQAIARLASAPDVIVSMTTPPFCGLIARRLRRKRGIPYCLWCMDLYPEALLAKRWIRPTRFSARMLAGVARRERLSASAVITLGPDMTERIRESAPSARIEEVPVWGRRRPTANARQEAEALRLARGWGDRDIVLMYSGHIGRAHRVSKFVELARQSAGRSPRIRVVIAGFGPALAEWKAEGGGHLEWLNPVAPQQAVSHLLTADVHLISQKPEWTGVVVPSKYQTSCLLGLPVLFDGPTDSAIAQWIRDGDTGWILSDDHTSSCSGILDVLGDRATIARKGENACRQGNRLFDPEINTMKLARLIENVKNQSV